VALDDAPLSAVAGFAGMLAIAGNLNSKLNAEHERRLMTHRFLQSQALQASIEHAASGRVADLNSKLNARRLCRLQ
jgi:hypothetical protein